VCDEQAAQARKREKQVQNTVFHPVARDDEFSFLANQVRHWRHITTSLDVAVDHGVTLKDANVAAAHAVQAFRWLSSSTPSPFAWRINKKSPPGAPASCVFL
jgi:hypothetical protein